MAAGIGDGPPPTSAAGLKMLKDALDKIKESEAEGERRGWDRAIEAAAEFIQKEAGALHQLNMLPNEAARLDSHAAAIRKLKNP